MAKNKLAEKYKEVFEEQIIYRGKEYFKKNRVEKVYKTENGYLAKVSGSYDNEYTVQIEVEKDGLIMHCDCPYNKECKHEYATLLAIDEKMYKKIALLPVENDIEIDVKKLIQEIPEVKLKKYISKMLECEEVLTKEMIIDEFEMYLPEKSKEYLYATMYNAFQLDDFYFLMTNYTRLAKKSLENRKYMYAFKIVSSIIEAYMESECEDDEIVTDKFHFFTTIIRIAKRKGNKNVKAEIEEWIKKMKEKEYYNDIYFEDLIEMI